MARPLVVQRVPPAQVQQNQSHPTSFFVDFGKEFQGGVILNVDDAKAGTVLRFIASELLLPNGTSDATTQSRYARFCVSCPRWALDSCSAPIYDVVLVTRVHFEQVGSTAHLGVLIQLDASRRTPDH
jgi:hypothetical protein